MKVTINGRTYFVNWKYNKTGKRLTHCFIRVKTAEGDEIISKARAKCFKDNHNHVQDCPIKAIGRKIAFDRAVRAIEAFGKEERTKFWNAYKKMIHGNWRGEKKWLKKHNQEQHAEQVRAFGGHMQAVHTD